MKKLINLQETINEMELKTTESGVINQTQRNTLKKDFLDILNEFLDDAGFDTTRTDDGVVITFQANKPVYIAIDGVIKNTKYDLETAKNEYELKLERQAEREASRKERASKKLKLVYDIYSELERTKEKSK